MVLGHDTGAVFTEIPTVRPVNDSGQILVGIVHAGVDDAHYDILASGGVVLPDWQDVQVDPFLPGSPGAIVVILPLFGEQGIVERQFVVKFNGPVDFENPDPCGMRGGVAGLGGRDGRIVFDPVPSVEAGSPVPLVELPGVGEEPLHRHYAQFVEESAQKAGLGDRAKGRVKQDSRLLVDIEVRRGEVFLLLRIRRLPRGIDGLPDVPGTRKKQQRGNGDQCPRCLLHHNDSLLTLSARHSGERGPIC